MRTLYVNYLRASCLGFYGILLMLFSGELFSKYGMVEGIVGFLIGPFLAGAGLLIFLFVLHSFGKVFGSLVGAPFAIVGSFFAMWADPLMWLIYKTGIIPTEKYNFLNFTAWIKVGKNTSGFSIVDSETGSSDKIFNHTQTDWNNFARAVISNDHSKLPSGDIGILGKAVLNKDLSYLPSGELGEFGRAIINGNLNELPQGELGQLGRAMINKNSTELPGGSAGAIGRSIINNDTKDLPNF